MTKRLDPATKQTRRNARAAVKFAKAIGQPSIARLWFELMQDEQRKHRDLVAIVGKEEAERIGMRRDPT